jgi:signal transduction histidine kinase/ActR/RegA family two-component response regulator
MKTTSTESPPSCVEKSQQAQPCCTHTRSSEPGLNGAVEEHDPLVSTASDRPSDLGWNSDDLAHRTVLVVENARLYRELQVASRRKDEFLAMLGHELRNPLAPIRNSMEVLRLKAAVDPEIQEVTAMVERQILQLTRLINDLVDVSRVGHGKINLEMQRVDLNHVAARAVEMSRPLLLARNQILEVTLPDNRVEVDGDAGRLAQVVSNLLNNSAKYSADGSRIELIVEAIGATAVLRVRDNGIGIEREMLPEIFDLFTQVTGAESRRGEGLGIGLSLVRNIVELHDGGVNASSGGLGCGAEFTIRLPLFATNAEVAPAALDKASSVPPATGRRILLVDDNKDSADSMAILLRLCGHKVQTAYDGQTALIVARHQLPEVVICDLSMPIMGGFELARRLRQDLAFADTLLVAFSGFAQEDDIRRSQEVGFNAHLVKPVRLETLKAILSREDRVPATSAGPSKMASSVRSL